MTPNDYVIGIPSFNRAEMKERFCTHSYLGEVADEVLYWVEPQEVEKYHDFNKKNFNGQASVISCQGLDRLNGSRVWGAIMDDIIDNCCKLAPKVVIMDDDLSLTIRPKLPAQPTYFEPMTPKLFPGMLNELCKLATAKCPLVSTQYRQFCQAKKAKYQHNQRISMIWVLDSHFFNKHQEFRFYKESRLQFMTDYYFFMKLLRYGHPNLCVNRYTKDDKPNAPGGERDKRKASLFNKAVTKFAAYFPDHVKTYVKEGKGSWENGMLGVRIQASRAFNKEI